MTADNKQVVNQAISQITEGLFERKLLIDPLNISHKLKNLTNILTSITGVAKEHAIHDILAFSTLIASHQYKVKLCYGGIEPVSNFYFLVAETGGMKSTIHKKLLSVYLSENESKYTTYKENLADWKEDIRSLEDSARKLGQKLSSIDKPPKPINPNAYTNNTTFEGLLKVLTEKDLSLVSDDGGRIYESVGTNKDNIKKFHYGLNDLWGSNLVDNLRSTGEYSTYVPPGKVVNMVISTQRHVFDGHIATKNSENSGFGGRVLVSVPKEATKKGKLSQQCRKEMDSAIEEFSAKLSANLYNPKPLDDRVVIELSECQNEILEGLGDVLRDESVEGGRAENHRAFTLKFVEHIHRIAVAVMWLEGELAVTDEVFACALELGRFYFASHYRYMHSADRSIADRKKAYSKIKKWIKEKREDGVYFVSKRHINIYAGRVIEKVVLQEVLQDLIDEEILTSMFGTPVDIDGKKCKTAYKINQKTKEPVDFGDIRADPADSWVTIKIQ